MISSKWLRGIVQRGLESHQKLQFFLGNLFEQSCRNSCNVSVFFCCCIFSRNSSEIFVKFWGILHNWFSHYFFKSLLEIPLMISPSISPNSCSVIHPKIYPWFMRDFFGRYFSKFLLKLFQQIPQKFS